MISTLGEVIAADDQKMVRFLSNSNTPAPMWPVSYSGIGTPISPVLISGNRIAFVTGLGYVRIYDADNGTLLGSGKVADEVRNTPAVNGSIIYVTTNLGLRAIDLTNNNPNSILWTFTWTEQGGASPLFWDNVIYTDGRINLDWFLFAINTNGTEKWRYNTPSRVPASVAQDPRNDSIWFFPLGGRLTRLDLNGRVIEQITDIVLGGTPSSAITTGGTSTSPILLIGNGVGTNAGVTAINLNTSGRLWRVNGVPTAGQFGILRSGLQFRVGCTGIDTGLFLLGEA